MSGEGAAMMIVELRDVCKEYLLGETTVHAMRHLSLAIDEGEFVVVLGPSGCGKTTLLNMVSTLDRPTSGQVFVDGEEVSAYTDSERTRFRAKKVGLVFQFYNLFPALTARENVEIGLAPVIKDAAVMRQRAEEYLRLVGLGDQVDKFPAQMSGGEQQRVAIARALAKEPRLLLADEPTGNLDAESGEMVWQLLRELNERTGTTVIAVTHQTDVARLASRIVHLRSGQLADTGQQGAVV